MRNILLVLFILNLGCSAKKDPVPVYTSIDGNWKFTSVNTSGEFTVAQGKVTSGYFAFGGTKYTIDTPATYLIPAHIDLRSSGYYLTFKDVHPGTDFKTIVSHSYEYFIGAIEQGGSVDITINRKP